jgi:single-stranded-DNA-specific exonuclease
VRAFDLYLEDDPARAAELVEKVLFTNQRRKDLQKHAEELAASRCLDNDQDFVWVYHPEIHQGVVGLVATKLTQTLKVPAFVGSVSSQQGTITGSARRPDGSEVNLVEALTYASSALKKFGGHAPAAGFELEQDQAQKFGELLKEYFSQNGEAKSSHKPWSYDLEITMDDVTPYFYKWLEHLEPYGAGFPYPVFSLKDIEISKVRILKDRHLKFTFLGRSKALEGIWFSPPLNALEKWSQPYEGRVQVLGELNANRFRGVETLQFMVQNIRPAN